MKGVRVDMDTVTNVVQALRAGDMHTEISDRFRVSQSMISLIARRARAESMWPVLLLGERFDEKGRGHRA